MQGTSGEGRLAALLSPHVTSPGTSFRSFGTGLTEQTSVVFLDLEMLSWSPGSLTFSRGTEAVSSITGLLSVQVKTPLHPLQRLIIQKPVLPGRPKAPVQHCCWAFSEDPTWAQQEGGCLRERGGTAKYMSRAEKVIRWRWNLR